jgi:hypothetical protein
MLVKSRRAFLVLSVFALILSGCGSAWCSLCETQDRKGGGSGAGGYSGTGGPAPSEAGSGGASAERCPTNPLQHGSTCEELDRLCIANLADGQILGCSCAISSTSTMAWSCDVVSCPETFNARDVCSVYLLGESCEMGDSTCTCRWDADSWQALWEC